MYCDAAHAFGCQVNNRAIGSCGRAEVFSFHATNILSTAEGGCITTNDDTLASKLRAMRGDHVAAIGAEMQSATARMSEIQAAIGLMMLDDFDRNRQNNEEQHRSYEKRLSATPGIRILKHSGVTRSNFQNFVGVLDSAEFGLTRDELLAVLAAEKVAAERQFYPSSHAVSPFSDSALELGQLSNTESAACSTFQLPIGARVTADSIEQICDIVCEAQMHAKAIKSVLALRSAT
jgi:dTDP-4-amino-4,6-dideoxygalactose transaminase